MESQNVPGEKAESDPIRVLIAGPDPMVMYIVGRCVHRNRGFACVGRAFTCEELKEALRRTSVDLVLMEPAMSRRGKLESIRIVQRCSDSMMIILSRIADVAMVDAILGYRVFDFILKPFDVERLDASLCAFRSYHKRWGRLSGPLIQSDIDELMLWRRGALVAGDIAPKGIQPERLTLIMDTFRNDPGKKISVADVAVKCSISRTTAWRYLEYLVASGYLCRTASFRSVGRPVQLYRLV